MSASTRFQARMVVASDAKVFGRLVVLAVLAGALPLVMTVQRQPPSGKVLWLCVLAGIGLAVAAWKARTAGLHDVRLDRQGDQDVLTVAGSRLNLTLRGPLTARALRAETVASSGRRTVRMPLRILIIEQDGAPVLVLEEAVRAPDPGPGWAEATDEDLDYGEAPVLCKGLVPADLERLRPLLPSSLSQAA